MTYKINGDSWVPIMGLIRDVKAAQNGEPSFAGIWKNPSASLRQKTIAPLWGLYQFASYTLVSYVPAQGLLKLVEFLQKTNYNP